MQQWDLTSVDQRDRTGPRVLFSTAEARCVVIDLAENEVLRDHQVRERAVVQVVHGSATVSSGADTTPCAAGALILFEPSELHSVRALEPTRLLLVLAPWPATGLCDAAEGEDPHALPINATEPPTQAQSKAN